MINKRNMTQDKKQNKGKEIEKSPGTAMDHLVIKVKETKAQLVNKRG